MITEGKLNILIGGQFGSEGKGAVASAMGSRYFDTNKTICVSNAGANSGHTYCRQGKKYVSQYLPVSAVFAPGAMIFLCAGSIINPDMLLSEIEMWGISKSRITIHPRATIITDDDIAEEDAQHYKSFSSTCTGNGAALANKIRRAAKVAKDVPKFKGMIGTIDFEWYFNNGFTAFMEVSQGYQLSLNSGLSYPHCTSREVTVSEALSQAGVHPSLLGQVTVVMRSYPIRVGHGEGDSGPLDSDSVETSWGKIGVNPEHATISKKQRRVATFSSDNYYKVMKQLKPDNVVLSFADYLSVAELHKMLKKYKRFTHIQCGPRSNDLYDLKR